MAARARATMRPLLALALVMAVSSSGASNNETTGGTDVRGTAFLTNVIRRIESDRNQVAKPVQDLQVALDRIAEIFGPEAPSDEGELTFEFPVNNEVLSTPSTQFPNGASPVPTAGPSPSVVTATLSPQELQALYQLAAEKGLALDLSSIQGGFLPPTTPKPNEALSSPGGISGPTPLPPASSASTPEPADGYYYYFVPIKNLNSQMQLQQPPAKGQMTNHQQSDEQQDSEPGGSSSSSSSSMAGAAADMAASAAVMAGGADRAVEPLFMAMAGFVGMALMFVASVLFLPKLGALRSLKHAPDEVASFGKLVIQSIEGKDCSERLTCEIGRAARTLRLGGKPLRVLELLLPPPMAHQISRIRRAVARKDKCNFIPCKYRRPPKVADEKSPPKRTLPKPVVLKPSAKPSRQKDKPPSRPHQPTPSIYGTPPPSEEKAFPKPRPPQQKKTTPAPQKREPRGQH